MKVIESGLFLLAKPRVLHAIPGRLRLHVPFLKHLDERYGSWAVMMCELLAVPEGIEKVSPSMVTGNVLLQYDHTRLSERELLEFINAMSKIFLNHRKDFTRLKSKDPTVILPRLKAWLGDILTRRLHLDARERIPADVFH